MPVSYCKSVYSIRTVISFTVIQYIYSVSTVFFIYSTSTIFLIYSNNTVYCIHEYNYCISICSIRIDFLLHNSIFLQFTVEHNYSSN